MALLAGLREARTHVVWIRGALKVFQVARYARGAGQFVVVIEVAIGTRARRNGMRARQSESRSRVIKLAVCPGHAVMALLARGGKAGVGYGSGRRVEIVLVTTDTGRAGQIVIIVDVAIRA